MLVEARTSPEWGTRLDVVVRRTIAATIAAATLLLGAAPAQAASTVDVTYDLSDASIQAHWLHAIRITYANDHPLNGTLSGSMKVRYTSDSSGGMPIQTGAVSLRSFNLRVQDTNPSYTFTFDITLYTGTRPGTRFFTGTFHWQLTAPAAGNLTAGGALTGLSGNLLLSARVNCLASVAGYCERYFDLPTQTVTFTYLHGGAFKLAGDPGPFGGAKSTRHTLTGSGPIAVPFNGTTPGSGFSLKSWTAYPNFGNVIVGREVARAPEPGTLGLVSVGVGALALAGGVGWAEAYRRRKETS